jgi:RNA exonuclease 1
MGQDQQLSGSEEKKCACCGSGFVVTLAGKYVTHEQCIYHWGKLEKAVAPQPNKVFAVTTSRVYSCCGGNSSSVGCTMGKLHVWNGIGPGVNDPLDGYVRTRVHKTFPPDGKCGVYGLDCEMCYTTHGLELLKVTVVAADGHSVYDSLVRPENDITDLNTRFSGITARDIHENATKSLRDVQKDLTGFINADTILVGHGLETDLHVLRIIHDSVVDTSVIFPHCNGLPYRHSLKSLVSHFLGRDIQQGSSGHCSLEDARACMDLMLWRIRTDFHNNFQSGMPIFFNSMVNSHVCPNKGFCCCKLLCCVI